MTYLEDKSDETCLLTKVLITKLIQFSNPPLTFRTPEFLQSLEVGYFGQQETFLLIIPINLLPIDFHNNLEFLIYMKNWKYNDNNLFYRTDFFASRVVFLLSHEGWLNLLLKLNECNASYFGLEND